MALACLEGFDGLASYSEIGLRSWRSVGAGLKYGSSSGRRGSGGIYDDTAGSTTERGIEYHVNFFRDLKTFWQTSSAGGTDIELGFAFKLEGTGWDNKPSTYSLPLCELFGTSNSLNWLELFNNAGTWQIRLMTGATARLALAFPGEFGVGSLPARGQWHYITLLISGLYTSNAANQFSHLIIDNNTSTSVTTATNSSAVERPRYLRLGCGNGASADITSGDAVYYDDVYVATGVGEYPAPVSASTLGSSTYAGPMRVDIKTPAFDNIYFDDEFVASSGPGDVEYPMVIEAPHDGDTTYVSSSTVGHTAQGGYGPFSGNKGLPHSPSSIKAVKGNAVVRNAGDGIVIVRCDLANLNARDTGNNYTYSLPAGGAYEGLHALYAGDSTADGSLNGAANASTTVWDVAGGSNDVGRASALLEYVS